MIFSTSHHLIKNSKHFLNIKHYTFLDKLFKKCGTFYGWGRKKSGDDAITLAKRCGGSFVLLEDGFIRSHGLGVDGSKSFSIVEDDVGIYYDATAVSRLENILSSYGFESDVGLMKDARRAMAFIREHYISKYNDAPMVDNGFCQRYGLDSRFHENDGGRQILIIAQTAGDASLEYGMLKKYTTDEIITTAIAENPNAKLYLKIHPDVLSGKKQSDIDIKNLDKRVSVITENVNPISLLKHFDKVYVKTSGMGFEALIVGCECVCFGMPYYAGWGVTDDRVACIRRERKLSVEEIFAGAYMLYVRYHNPYIDKPSDLFEVMEELSLKTFTKKQG